MAATTNPDFAVNFNANRNVNTQNKITRGYIRRDADRADPTSRYRLKFMFNPESITRQYVAYLDQGAIDPYNTIYGSGNLVAPPGILDFNFDLFFDRQIESDRSIYDRGTQVDYDYFDRVVRASEPGQATAGVPDNGVLLVNPRNITVVFSNQLTVQGRPYNATITYSKFSHRMVPTRMSINLSMKVFYIGPPAQPFDLHLNTATETFKATVSYNTSVKVADVNTKGAYVLPDASVYDTLFPLPAAAAAEATTASTAPSTVGTGDGSDYAVLSGPLVTENGTTLSVPFMAIWRPIRLAAIAAGFTTIGGGGYRSRDQQIKLRSTNGCPDVFTAPSSSCRVPTAIPGHSRHEGGNAIDVTLNGQTISHGGLHDWLNAHQTANFKNLPSEAWHYSIDGK